MRLRIDQLDKHLEGSLASIYVLGGDEPLQIQEARDAIRAAAVKQGFDERVVLSAETGFRLGCLPSARCQLVVIRGQANHRSPPAEWQARC